MAKSLTKSRFKIALACPTRLFYENALDEAGEPRYRNRQRDDAQLAALADGGHQIGALALFKYHPDPIGQAITVEAKDYETAVADTRRRLDAPGRVVIAEAALRHEGFFARVDLLIRDPKRKTIEIIEVKSKGVADQDIASRFKTPDWQPYLYDVAFQAQVAAWVFPGWHIEPKLLLLDKAAACDVGGLQEYLPVVTGADGRHVGIDIPPGLRREALGRLDILREVDVSDVVNDLRHAVVPAPHAPAEHVQNLVAFMQWTSGLQANGTRHFGGVSKACKDCPYRAASDDPLASGVHECMEQAVREGLLEGAGGPVPRDQPLAIDLWGLWPGKVSMSDRVLKARRLLLADVQDADIAPPKPTTGVGFTPFERRLAQLQAARDPSFTYALREDRLADMDRWAWPLHMIDFETTAPGLPFFQGSRPHDLLAFQFSHHVMEKDAQGRVRIRHATQWLSTEAGVFPNFDFVRALRQALMPDGELRGTVLRYHAHENTVLVKLRQAIAAANLPDGAQLIAFIDLITDLGKGHPPGPKAMVDLHALVREGYYSAKAGASISLKYILPALLQDAANLRQTYARAGVYGKGLMIPSLNFDGPQGQVWLREDLDWNPYRTLPPVFGPEFGALDAMLLRLGSAGDEEGSISQGGAAMTAYNHTQSSRLPAAHRQRIREALLRYCELDTLAMAMLVQGLMELRGKPLALTPANAH